MTVDERIQLLERKLTRRTQMCAAVLLACAALLHLGASGAQDKITAREFVLVDATGAARGTWSASDGHPRLMLLDAQGREHLELRYFEDKPSVILSDAAGRERAFLQVNTIGPALVMMDAAGHVRLGAGMNPKGPDVTLMSPAQKPRVSLSDYAGGPSGLMLMDDRAVRRGELVQTPAGAQLVFRNAQGVATNTTP